MRGASPPDASGVFAFVVSFCSVLRKMHWASLHFCFFCVIFCGEGTAPPRQMHWVSLHVLFFLLLGVFACVVFFVIFCLLLVFFLRDVLGSNVAVRGGNL